MPTPSPYSLCGINVKMTITDVAYPSKNGKQDENQDDPRGMKVTTGSDNVFRDLGFGKAEAENLKLRSDLMIRVVKLVKQSGMTQARAARELDITQPRLNQLLKGKIQPFSLDALVNMLAQAGMRVNMTVKKAAYWLIVHMVAIVGNASLAPMALL